MSSNAKIKKHSAYLESNPVNGRSVGSGSPDLALRLDHVILRSPDPAATLTSLEQVGMPVISPLQPLAGGAMQSGIVRGGAVDVEVLGVGEDAPLDVEGYGLGFTAPGHPIREVSARLRAIGLPTSGVIEGRAKTDGQHRRWRVVQVADLLPEPFPVPLTTRTPGALEWVSSAVLGLFGRLPAVARAATRRAGRSMIVITEYDFDVEAWRTTAHHGPSVVEVEIGVGDALAQWAAVGPVDGPRLLLDAAGPKGVRRLTLAGDSWQPGRPDATLGSVTLSPPVPI